MTILSVLPELALLLVIAILLVQSMASSANAKNTAWLPLGGVACLAASLVSLGERGLFLGDAFQVDALSQYFKFAVALGVTLVSVTASRSTAVGQDKRPDYLMLLCLSAWGLMLLSSAVELITIYVALEISSYSLYAVLPLRAQDRRAAEAGVKYILFGAASTALALYGYSLILAGAGETYLSGLAGFDFSLAATPAATIGLLLFLCGMFFKLALFPFHHWSPDVYQGASNETAAFVATLPKLGAVVVLVRIGALLTPQGDVTLVLAVLGAASMTYGNLAALAQKDLKRMLGYSSVAHAGYVTLGLVACTSSGLAAAAFYTVVYLLMNLACFLVISSLAPDGRNLTYADLDGLHSRSPGLALILAVAAFALVGLPPTAGFMGKLFLLGAAWGHGYDWLVVVAALNTAIAIFYYLSMVRHAYTHDATQPAARPSGPCLVAGGIMAAAILLLGAAPGILFNLALGAGTMLMP